MESGRVDLENGAEVNGTNKPTVATYKPLPDDDTNWKSDKEDKSKDMGKQDNEEIKDGAEEKMLNDEAKISPKKDVSQVIFVSENGDAKIDVAVTKPTLSGMGKEELMKYANDPFWVRLRWFLFISFWVLWFAMLAGAVTIIVLAPKCAAPAPKSQFERSPMVQLEPKDLEGRDRTSLEKLSKNLQDLHVSVISLSSILKSSAPGHVTDFRDVDDRIGMQMIKDLIEITKKNGQKVVLEIDPNHSGIDHVWFNKSVNREEPYTNYYVWASAKIGEDGSNNAPSNWKSVNNYSAWEWNEKRGQYYLHQFNRTQPDLNFNSSLVINEFNKIFDHWLSLGISGFRLGLTQYLTEDPNLSRQSNSIHAADIEEYESQVHVHTKDRVENGGILEIWKNHTTNGTGEILFSLSDDTPPDNLAKFNQKKELIVLPQSSRFLYEADGEISAETLREKIVDWYKHVANTSSLTGVGWDLNGKGKPLRERMPPATADSLTLMTLLLPGTPILKLNDVLTTNETQAVFEKLADKRNDQVFLYGDFNAKVINGTVFAYTRSKSGLPGYLVAYQSSDQPAVIDVSVLPQVPDKVTVLTWSPNYVTNGLVAETPIPSDSVPISPKSTLVLTFVPSTK